MFECVNHFSIRCKSLHVVVNGACWVLYVHACIDLFAINSSIYPQIADRPKGAFKFSFMIQTFLLLVFIPEMVGKYISCLKKSHYVLTRNHSFDP